MPTPTAASLESELAQLRQILEQVTQGPASDRILYRSWNMGHLLRARQQTDLEAAMELAISLEAELSTSNSFKLLYSLRTNVRQGPDPARVVYVSSSTGRVIDPQDQPICPIDEFRDTYIQSLAWTLQGPYYADWYRAR